MTKDTLNLVEKLGFSAKASRVYLAGLELGEATVQMLSSRSGVKRTTLYYTLKELLDAGALIETKRNKKVWYLPESPRNLLKNAKERLWDAESEIELLESLKHATYKKPRIYFLYGPQGFKQIWDMIFSSKTKEFRILTEGMNFLDFVKEKYILDGIIKRKRELGVRSRQIIVDSPYAQKIVVKDLAENRESKIIPSTFSLPFTEVICDEFVALISPRWDNTLFVVENTEFARTRRNAFEIMWNGIQKTPKK